MNDLDAARQRISELEDNAARLEGRMGTALNRIQELEDERNALRKGLQVLVSYVNLDLAAKKQGGHGFPTRIAEALAAAQALLGKSEPSPTERPIPVGDARDRVCARIRSIAETYREQSARPGGVSTPGGLEHMGDVWTLLLKWDAELAQERVDPAKAKP